MARFFLLDTMCCGCALTIDTMRQNPSELTLRAELSG